jgi:hypothetical protein
MASRDKPALQTTFDKQLPTRRPALRRRSIAQNPKFNYFSRKPIANVQSLPSLLAAH